MMSKLRDVEHREMVDELSRKISQLEAEVTTSLISIKVKVKVIYTCSCCWNPISQLQSVTCDRITQCYLSAHTSEHTPP